ncbi:ATP-dependent nuclease [Pasteurella multocida]|uniref:ATP-dependent nuclease n=1 Tax=Pasteurella multocida TaxID=747 RepID=UPI0012EA191A|nr:AAA family ATPase [Pasteurella multocida]MCL7815597.1 AAA family ATPase [Pasteurella multocida]MDY0640055.1 AAA family ATPase [Pasteurella multocida]MEB3469633.1 AAA family ATPase [Pasteurella multocida]NMK14943.1 AAA family ATPase [Pasteurella multocida]NNH92628.1 ATP-dependent endonuclease [Pasteurella multocida]
MKVLSAKIKNFRLLSDIELNLEEQTTVIVGRNNSGKTSLTEIIKRFLGEKQPSFRLEDFSVGCYQQFLALFQQQLSCENACHQDIETNAKTRLPAIELSLIIQYDRELKNFGVLSPFVIDLNEDCLKTIIVIRYELQDGKLEEFFSKDIDLKDKNIFKQELKNRILKLFTTKVWAQDPNDDKNQRELSLNDVKKLIKVDFIHAQRGLEDITIKEPRPLGKLLEDFFKSTSASKNDQDKSRIKELEDAVYSIQNNIQNDFTDKLTNLFPPLESFGYPGLGTQTFKAEVILDVEKILSNFTHVYYPGDEINLPESYNGLGTRNLLVMLFQLAKFYKEFSIPQNSTQIHLIFIEEPEAHLHPQMQEIFIKQISEAIKKLAENQVDWSPQCIISTHSSHISNATSFEHIRYFLQDDKNRKTKIKDLRKDFSDTQTNKDFIHKYMTLTKSDLFFADKAILIEGMAERLMLPIMIEKLDLDNKTKLKNKYLTLLEVGGAYAHNFIPLLKFLELKTLIVTDLDSVKKCSKGKACEVHKGVSTSNACIKSWFNDEKDLSVILQKTDLDKVKGKIRIAYQCPEKANSACGRSFEDAFILANSVLFTLKKTNKNEIETEAYTQAKGINKKSDFAIEYAINQTTWNTPKYIKDGLVWLAKENDI